MQEYQSNNQLANDSFLRKFFLMTIVVFVVYVMLGLIGFFLWFAFPVEKINGLTYLAGNSLIYYYLIVNFMDIVGVLLFSHFIYFKRINTKSSVKDGLLLGLYLILTSWIIDLLVYVFIRKTLPSIHEYFLGKNQPEIGIAWLIAFASALGAGWLHSENRNFIRKISFRRSFVITLSLLAISVLMTIIGIKFFDIRP